MSHTPLSHQSPEQLAWTGIKAGAAVYSLDRAAKGIPLSQETPAAQAARTGGNLVMASMVWHYVFIPYAIITGIIFGLPAIIAGGLTGHTYTDTVGNSFSPWLSTRTWDSSVVLPILIPCAILWLYFAIWKWFFKGFIFPAERYVTGRPQLQKGEPGDLKRFHTTRKQSGTMGAFASFAPGASNNPYRPPSQPKWVTDGAIDSNVVAKPVKLPDWVNKRKELPESTQESTHGWIYH